MLLFLYCNFLHRFYMICYDTNKRTDFTNILYLYMRIAAFFRQYFTIVTKIVVGIVASGSNSEKVVFHR